MKKYEVTTIIKNGEAKPVTSFEFETAKGGTLTVNGSLAKNVCALLNADLSDRMANITKGWIFATAKKLDINWKEQYSVKDAKAFYVQMLAIDPNQFNNYSLAVERFYYELDGELKPMFPEIEPLGIGKLIKLGAYYADAKERNKTDKDSDVESEVYAKIKDDFHTGVINRFMSDKAFEEAIKKSLKKTIDEPKTEDKKPEAKPEDKKPEDKKPEDKKPEDKKPEATPKDMINEQSVMFTALKKLGVAMDLYESIKGMEIKTEKERKLEAVIKAFVSASEYTMEIFK